MKTYIAFVAFALFVLPKSFGLVDISLTDDGSTVTVTYIFTDDYDTNPRWFWNSQTIAMRWLADGSGSDPVSMSGFSETSEFDFGVDGLPMPDDPTPGAATYYYQKFTGNITFKQIPYSNGNTQVVFTFDYTSSDGPPMFELVTGADIPGGWVNWDAAVNASAIIPNNQFGTFINPNTFPVEWLGFDAKPINAVDVALDWATANEVNNSHFAIERSVDATLFETIGRVNGSGTTNEMKEYTYIDEGVGSSLLYYRLKQIDFNGAFAYSDVVEVDFSKFPQLKGIDFSIYPSPTTDMINVELKGKLNENLVLRITDLTGRLVYEGQSNIITGNNTINVSKFTEGIYYVSLANVKNNSLYGLGKFVKE